MLQTRTLLRIKRNNHGEEKEACSNVGLAPRWQTQVQSSSPEEKSSNPNLQAVSCCKWLMMFREAGATVCPPGAAWIFLPGMLKPTVSRPSGPAQLSVKKLTGHQGLSERLSGSEL
ncbi:hypothetical protein RRG08_017012 [Elysia crispata]|uniref:Uncharacterized protein n=1 Tax=Elysia crispata TaxID=231223 RepID=A0AAE0XZV3_9GAST|nr:hypothetical protein RRG08_017012 [Elysia crispata]